MVFFKSLPSFLFASYKKLLLSLGADFTYSLPCFIFFALMMLLIIFLCSIEGSGQESKHTFKCSGQVFKLPYIFITSEHGDREMEAGVCFPGWWEIWPGRPGGDKLQGLLKVGWEIVPKAALRQ